MIPGCATRNGKTCLLCAALVLIFVVVAVQRSSRKYAPATSSSTYKTGVPKTKGGKSPSNLVLRDDQEAVLVFDRGQKKHVPNRKTTFSDRSVLTHLTPTTRTTPVGNIKNGVYAGFNFTERKESDGNRYGATEQCWSCQRYDITSTLTDEFDCIPLKIEPFAPICPHPKGEGGFASQLIRETGTWEKELVEVFQQVLRDNPNYGVIDLGANIGQYSLVAAKMGHTVLAVEPSLGNIKRLQKASQLANTTNRITLLQNALSNDTETPSGDANDAKVIHLNDLVTFVSFSDAVMRMDAQGQEHRAFAHAERMFDFVNIHYVFVKWISMLEHYNNSAPEANENRMLVETMIQVLLARGYVPHSIGGVPLTVKSWFQWPPHVMWKRGTSSERKKNPWRSFGEQAWDPLNH